MKARIPRIGSSASVSAYSDSQRTTNSSRTAQPLSTRGAESMPGSPPSTRNITDDDDINLTRIKALVMRAALNKGYQRSPNAPALAIFVRNLPSTAFGTTPWETSLYESYRRLVLTDPALRDMNGFPRGRRFTPAEVATAVRWLIGNNEAYAWLDLLYAWVLGYSSTEGMTKKMGGIQV